MKPHQLALILAIIVLTACTQAPPPQQSANYTDGVFELRTSGGFTPADQAIQHLRVSATVAELSLYAYNGTLTKQMNTSISPGEYQELLGLFLDGKFLELKDSYEPDVLVTDVGEATITLSLNGIRKRVRIAPYVNDGLPRELVAINERMQSLITRAIAGTPSDAARIAANFIASSPTYIHGGRDLTVVDTITLESYPPQYVVSFSFNSETGGYGAGAGGTALKLYPRTAKVTVANMNVISASIDGVWDEMSQQPINTSKSPDTPVSSNTSIEFCGISTKGACRSDADCVIGGCSGQVCQSKNEPPRVTTCEFRDCYDPGSMGCGCINNQCQWG